jgi:hypothetical protein
MATKNKNRLFETDLQMEMTLERVVDQYVEPDERKLPSSMLSNPPRQEVVDRVIKKVRKL